MLLFCAILAVCVLGITAATVTLAVASSDWFQHSLEHTAAVSLADSAIELRQKHILTSVANFID